MSNKKSIAFMTPGLGGAPTGGLKVILEYANRLANDGFKVVILYPLSCNFKQQSIFNKIKIIPRTILWMLKGMSCKSWFNLNKNVKEKTVLSLNWEHVPKCDIYFATAVHTAYYLNQYPINNDRKFYLIQGFENWGISDEIVLKSYRFGFTNFVISNWLYEKVKESGAYAHIIKNGFDFNYFKLSNPIENRNRFSIAMLYHKDERKGCRYGIEALIRVKRKYPNLKVSFFGVPQRPKELPEWIEYYQKPDKETHNRIYNEASIYLAPSLQEGWGLTVGEAMICGACVICTDTLGFQEMIKDKENGIIVPISDSYSLSNAVIFLIENPEIRNSLAHKGNEYIKSFTWDNSYAKLKEIISIPIKL